MPWLTRIAILALFVAAASAAWWLDTTREPDPGTMPSEAAAQLPDYYLEEFRLVRYAGDGPPQQVLVGRHLDHFPATRTAEIAQPRVTHQPAEADLWRIRSDRGTLIEDSDVVELHGNVQLDRPPRGNTRPVSLRTERLDYAMGPEIARTELPVQVRSPGTRVDAVGMTARLAEDTVELLDRVRVTHDPALADGDATGD